MLNFIKENLRLIITWVVIIVVAVLGSIFVNLGMDWFDSLTKPSEWVPNFVIPIIWTIIYLLFAIVFIFLYKKEVVNTKIIVLGILNAVFNVLWCLVFFTLNQLLLGEIIIIINVVLGALLVAELTKTQLWYTFLLWVYPIWLSFATLLNTAVWIIN